MTNHRSLLGLTILIGLALANASHAATTVQTSGSVQWTDSVQSEYYGDSSIINFPTQTYNTETGNITFNYGVATVTAGDMVYRGGGYTTSNKQYGQQNRFLQDYEPGDKNSYNKVDFSFSTPQSFFGALIANQGDIATFYRNGAAIGSIALASLPTYGPGYEAAGVNVPTYYLNASMQAGATYDRVTLTGGNTYVSDIRYSTTNIDLTTLTSTGTASAKTATAGSTDVPEPTLPVSLALGGIAAALGLSRLRSQDRAAA